MKICLTYLLLFASLLAFAQPDTVKKKNTTLLVEPLPIEERNYDEGVSTAFAERLRKPSYYGEYWKEYVTKKGKKRQRWEQFRSLKDLLPLKEKVTRMRLYFHDGAVLPDTIAQFQGVEELIVRCYDSVVVPPELWTLKNLKKLELRNWKTTESAEIGNLAQLEELEITMSGANAQEFPASIGKLGKLKKLVINSWKIKALPPEIGNLSSLETLKLYNNGLTELPPEIGKLAKLRRLHIQSNPLVTLPAAIGNLSSLTQLELPNNKKLSSLPPEIGNLRALELLNLYYDSLTALPPEIGNLAQLKRLDLRENKLLALPAEIGKLSSLETLELGFNRLSELPAAIGNLSALDTLHAYGNQLSGLPASIGNLRGLRELNLLNNPLSSLPPEITKLDSLQNFWLEKKGLLALPEATWNFANKTGLKIPGVPDRISGRSLSWYLQRKDIDPYSKLYVQGKMALASDEASTQMLDSLMTNNPLTAPFYLYVFNTLMIKDTGVYECVRFVMEYDIFNMSERIAAYVRAKPCEFFFRVVHGEYKRYSQCWREFACGDITREEALGELSAKMKKTCGTQFKKDVEKMWPVYYSEK